MHSFDELEQFLTHWYECRPEDIAWNGPLPPWLQSDVAEFYRRFGELTRDTGYFAVEGLPSPLAAQDIITPVEELNKREDDGVILIRENQDCWVAGQMPNSGTLWSSIDLEIGDFSYPGNQLFDMGLPIKEALITHALHETVMSAVHAGPSIDLKEWETAEEKIVSTGVVTLRRHVTPDEGALRIGWTDVYMAASWGNEEIFTWVVRKGDRSKGPRATPYTVGRPNSVAAPTESGILKNFVRRFF